MKQPVIGFRTHRDASARPGEQIVHLALLFCGHTLRVEHGHVPKELDCPDCMNPFTSNPTKETENAKQPLTQSSQELATQPNEPSVRSQAVRTATSGR
jgi:hypothetical protein